MARIREERDDGVTWYKDTKHGVYWMQENGDELIAREEFVEDNFEFAALTLGTTVDELQNASVKDIPDVPKQEETP